MSHIVTVATQVRDPVAVAAACRRLGLADPVSGTAKLYAGEASGLLVHLPGWRYPVAIDVAAGALAFDHYGGRWGDPAELDKFVQAYAVEKVRLEARQRGQTVTEQALPNGSVKLTIAVA